MFHINTLEMKKEIYTIEEEREVREKIKMLDIGYDNPVNGTTYQLFRYFGLCNKGVTIWIMRYKFKQNEIILRINPQTVFGENGKATLFEINEERLKECFAVVKKLLEEYEIDIDGFKVSRIDFTRDIQFEKTEVVDCIIKLLRKTGVPYRYSETKYGGKKYKDCYYITHNDNIVSVAVYNKEKQYRDTSKDGNAEIVKGVLRVEVRMMVVDGMMIYERGNLYYENIKKLENYASATIEKVFCDGFYIKLSRFKKILFVEGKKRYVGKRERNKLSKMLTLAEIVAYKQNLQEYIRGAGACFCYETMQEVLGAFEDRRINLVTISAKEKIQVIPDMRYLLGMKREEEMKKDYQFLMENHLDDKVPKYKLK